MNINIQLQSLPLLHEAFLADFADPGAGAVVWFNGQVRNHSQGKKVEKLEFEAYEPMAIKEMNQLAHKAGQLWPLYKVIMIHRLGTVLPGETAVLIGVSSAHRKEAFDACEWLIDQLKLSVPIWKKEFTEDGDVWVAAHP